MGAEASTAQIDSISVSSCGGRHIVFLTKALASEDIKIARAAAKTLEKLCHSQRLRERFAHQVEAVPILVGLLDVDNDQQVLVDALGALSWILEFAIAREILGEIQDAMERIIKLTRVGVLQIQKNAVKALGWVLLSDALLNKFAECRDDVIHVGSLIKSQHVSVKKEALIALQKAMSNDTILNVLIDHDEGIVFIEALINCLQDEKIRKPAAVALSLALRTNEFRERLSSNKECVNMLFSLIRKKDEFAQETYVSLLGWAFRNEGIRAQFAEEIDGMNALTFFLKSANPNIQKECIKTLGWAFRSKILREAFFEEKENMCDFILLISADNAEDLVLATVNTLGWSFRSEKIRDLFVEFDGYSYLQRLLHSSCSENIRKSVAICLQWGFDSESLREKFIQDVESIHLLLKYLDLNESLPIIKTGVVTLGCFLHLGDLDVIEETTRTHIVDALCLILLSIEKDEILREVLVSLGWAFRNEFMSSCFIKDEKNVNKVVEILTKADALPLMLRSAVSMIGCGLLWEGFRTVIDEYLDIISPLSAFLKISNGPDMIKAAVSSLSYGFVSDSFRRRFIEHENALQNVISLLNELDDTSCISTILEAAVVGDFVKRIFDFSSKEQILDKVWSLAASGKDDFRKSAFSFLGECIALKLIYTEDLKGNVLIESIEEQIFSSELWESSPRSWILSGSRMIFAIEVVKWPECIKIQNWDLWNLSEFWDTIGSLISESKYLEKIVNFVIWYSEKDSEEDISLSCYEDYRSRLRGICQSIPSILSQSSSFLWRLGWIESMLENTVFVIAVVGSVSCGKTSLIRSMFGDVGIPKQFFSTFGIPFRINLNTGVRSCRYFVHFYSGFDWEQNMIPEILVQRGVLGCIEKIELEEWEIMEAFFITSADGPEEENRKKAFSKFIRYIEIHPVVKKVPLVIYEIPEDRMEILDELLNIIDVCLYVVESRRVLESASRTYLTDLKSKFKEIIISITKIDEVQDRENFELLVNRFYSEYSNLIFMVSCNELAQFGTKKLQKALERNVLDDQDGFAMLDEVCLLLYNEFFHPYWNEILFASGSALKENFIMKKEDIDPYFAEIRDNVENSAWNSIKIIQNDFLPKVRAILYSNLIRCKALHAQEIDDQRELVQEWVSLVSELQSNLQYALALAINELLKDVQIQFKNFRSELMKKICVFGDVEIRLPSTITFEHLSQKLCQLVWLDGLDILYETEIMKQDTDAEVRQILFEKIIKLEEILLTKLSSFIISEVWSEGVNQFSMILEYLKVMKTLGKNPISKLKERFLSLRSQLDCIAEALTRVDDDDAECSQFTGNEWMVHAYYCQRFIQKKFPDLEIPDPGIGDSKELVQEWLNLQSKVSGDVAAAHEKFGRTLIPMIYQTPESELKSLKSLLKDTNANFNGDDKQYAQLIEFNCRFSPLVSTEELDLMELKTATQCIKFCEYGSKLSFKDDFDLIDGYNIMMNTERLACFESENEVLVVFKGDWSIQDAFKGKKSTYLYPEAMVSDSRLIDDASFHSGIVELCKLRIPEVEEVTKRAVQDKKRVVFTGHSVGGGIAICMAFYFRGNSILEEDQYKVYAFGSPQILDSIVPSWSKIISETEANSQINCFVNGWDIVPRVLGNRESAGVASFIRDSEGKTLDVHIVSDRYIPIGRYSWIRDDNRVFTYSNGIQKDFILLPQPLASSRLILDHRKSEYLKKLKTIT